MEEVIYGNKIKKEVIHGDFSNVVEKLNPDFLNQLKGLSIVSQTDYYYISELGEGPIIHVKKEGKYVSNIPKESEAILVDEATGIVAGIRYNGCFLFAGSSLDFEASDNNGAGYKEASWNVSLCCLIGKVPHRRELKPEDLIIDEKIGTLDVSFLKNHYTLSLTFHDDEIEDIDAEAFLNSHELHDIHYHGSLENYLKIQRKCNYPSSSCCIHLYLDGSKEETTSIHIPSSIKEIPSHAFYQCHNLKEVYFEDGVALNGDHAFCYCYGLEKIRLPRELKEIPEGCFFGCESLSSIVFPENLLILNPYCFHGCTSLDVSFPRGIEVYGEMCLSNCLSLNRIIVNKHAKKLAKDAFQYDEDLYVLFSGNEREYLNLTGYKHMPPNVYVYSEFPLGKDDAYWNYDEDGEPAVHEAWDLD